MDHIGVNPPPEPVRQRHGAAGGRVGRALRVRVREPRTFEPLDGAGHRSVNTRLLRRRALPTLSLLIDKMKTVDHEDNWEQDRPGFGTPGPLDRVFFSCAAAATSAA